MPRWPLYASFALHGAVAAAMAALPAAVRRAQQAPLQVAVVDKPSPTPPAPAPPPRPAPRQPRVRTARLTLPPPPSMKAPAPTPEPEVTAGIAPDSAAAAGTFAVPSGNTLYAPPPQTIVSDAPRPYAAERYAPAASLSELPRLVEQPDLRRFYPPEARRQEREGAVVLRLWLDASGAVSRAEIVSDPGGGLGEAALRAARELRFSPARLSGEPVATSVPFTLHFVLH